MIDKTFKMQGGIRNYLGKQKEVKAPLKWKSSPNHPSTELAYITQAEKDLLIKKDLHNSLKGKANRGPSGILSLNGWGSNDPGQNRAGGDVSGAMDRGQDDGNDRMGSTAVASQTMSPAEQKNAERVNATQLGLDLSNTKDYNTYHNIKAPSFFDSGLGKFLKNAAIATVLGPTMLGGTKIGGLLSTANTVNNLAGMFGKDIDVKNAFGNLGTLGNTFGNFNSTSTTSKGPKGLFDDGEGGEGGEGGNQQNALMSEYLLLLQRMEKGLLSAEEQGRFNNLKSRLGKAEGGIMNVNMNKGQLGETLHG